MSRATVERYTPSAAPVWDALVAGARARHFLFERAYMDYHADRFEDASLLVSWNGRPVAALPASRHGDEVISHGGLTFGGLLASAELTTPRAVDALSAITATLRADGVRSLIYKPVPHIYHLAPAEEDLFALHAAGAVLTRRDASTAIPAGPRPALSSERRRAVRRGAEAGLEIGESTMIHEFMALVAAVLRSRHDAEPIHTAQEMRVLADRFPGQIRLWAACEGAEIVAGVLVYETPAVAHAQYIAHSDRGLELRAGDALFDHLINVVYPGKWLDFGTSSERDGGLNGGLIRNKEGFGARAIVYDSYLLRL